MRKRRDPLDPAVMTSVAECAGSLREHGDRNARGARPLRTKLARSRAILCIGGLCGGRTASLAIVVRSVVNRALRRRSLVDFFAERLENFGWLLEFLLLQAL